MYICIFYHFSTLRWHKYHETSNIRGNVAGNKILDHSDVVGVLPVSAAPTPSFCGLVKDNCKTRWETFKFLDFVFLILEVWQLLKSFLQKDKNQLHESQPTLVFDLAVCKAGIDISQIFYLPDFQNYAFLQSAYIIGCRIKLCSNPLAQLFLVLLIPSYQAMGYVKPQGQTLYKDRGKI